MCHTTIWMKIMSKQIVTREQMIRFHNNAVYAAGKRVKTLNEQLNKMIEQNTQHTGRESKKEDLDEAKKDFNIGMHGMIFMLMAYKGKDQFCWAVRAQIDDYIESAVENHMKHKMDDDYNLVVDYEKLGCPADRLLKAEKQELEYDIQRIT